MKQIGILSVCFFCKGCTAIPPIIEVASWIKTGVDVISYVETDKTTTDHALSYVMDEDCSTFNLLQGKSICSPHHEMLASKMIYLNCNIYGFTENDDPYCKEDVEWATK